MGYNALAGGVLTGKYLEVPAATDDPNRVRSMASSLKPRGRMDEAGWGRTLPNPNPNPNPNANPNVNPIPNTNPNPDPNPNPNEAGWGRTLYRYRSGPADEATRT